MNNYKKNEVLVSICCTTYNHEQFIEDALKGFVNQKTSFDFEVLIHDDASTDRTAEIIMKYQTKYPNLIKPVIQDANQYSKGIQINRTFNYSRAQGKYIALCEGDDFWIDKLKLQKQVDVMDANPTCTFCFTNGKIIDERKKQQEKVFIPMSEDNRLHFYNRDCSYNVGELALLGFIPTATFMFRKSILEDPPNFYLEKFPGGDLKLKLYATSKGYAYYINDITSVYRTNVEGSTMSRWKEYGTEKLIVHNQKYINLINEVDKYNFYSFTKDFEKLRLPFESRLLLLTGDKRLFSSKKYSKWYKNHNILARLKMRFIVYLPRTYKKIKKTQLKFLSEVKR